MKNTIMIAALVLASAVPAMASKARLASLANSAHLNDVQDMFANPAELGLGGDFVTAEFGTTPRNVFAALPGSASGATAEGGFARSMGDAKYGFYLGHQSAWVNDVRNQSNTAGYLPAENAVNLMYATKMGDITYGAGLEYSNSDKKSSQEKQSATGLSFGATTSNWEAGATVGLINTYKNDASGIDFKGKNAFSVTGKYNVDSLTYVASYYMNGGKEETAGTTTADKDRTNMSIGVVNSMKKDGSDFFYGANYVMYTDKDATPDNKTEISSLPVFVGLEADATSWMVLRASVTQNFVLGTNKVTTAGAGGEADSIANNTTVAAGAGLKWNKLMLDGSIAGQTTGTINSTSLLANASLTYSF